LNIHGIRTFLWREGNLSEDFLEPVEKEFGLADTEDWF